MNLRDRIARISDRPVNGRAILVRADLNAPVRAGSVTDATRIERFASGARRLLDRGAALSVMTHFGRPGGKRDPRFDLEPVRAALSEALGTGVGSTSIAGEAIRPEPGECVMLDNLRFHPGEEEDDPEFAGRLACHGDLYVNDAFSCSHRWHASVHAITLRLPSYGGDGLLAEVDALERCLAGPERPLAAIVGGAKIDTKIGVLENLMERVDTLVIGGAMANTFLAEAGRDVGRSLREEDRIPTAARVRRRAAELDCALLLPVDAVVAEELRPGVAHRVADLAEVGSGDMILDVGPATVERIFRELGRSRTLLWNGPLGAFETDPFGEGTFALAKRVAELTEGGRLLSVAGGGDTVAALEKAGVTEDLSCVSTAGGAFLEWIEGRALPGIEALARAGDRQAEMEERDA